MRLRTLPAHTARQCKLALAALAASAAIGYAATIHAAPSLPPIPFMQRVEYTAPLPGSGPAPIVRSVIGDGATTIAFTWARQDEGSTGAYLFSCNGAVQPDDMGEACDVSTIVYDSFDVGDTASAALDGAAARRSTFYLVETSDDGTWRTIDHVALLHFDVSIPFVMR